MRRIAGLVVAVTAILWSSPARAAFGAYADLKITPTVEVDNATAVFGYSSSDVPNSFPLVVLLKPSVFPSGTATGAAEFFVASNAVTHPVPQYFAVLGTVGTGPDASAVVSLAAPPPPGSTFASLFGGPESALVMALENPDNGQNGSNGVIGGFLRQNLSLFPAFVGSPAFDSPLVSNVTLYSFSDPTPVGTVATLNQSPVPEPSSLATIAFGSALLLPLNRFRVISAPKTPL